jgi:hypothetical protein
VIALIIVALLALSGGWGYRYYYRPVAVDPLGYPYRAPGSFLSLIGTLIVIVLVAMLLFGWWPSW